MIAISSFEFESFVSEGTKIIDVREFGEYRENHFKGSVLIPSGSDISAFEPYREEKIVLVCQSETRAKNVGEKLKQAGFETLYYLKGGVNAAIRAELELESSRMGWSIDRQFRMFLGLMLFIAVLGLFFVSQWFLIIPSIFATGLIVTSLINRCYLRMGIARLPWNKARNF